MTMQHSSSALSAARHADRRRSVSRRASDAAAGAKHCCGSAPAAHGPSSPHAQARLFRDDRRVDSGACASRFNTTSAGPGPACLFVDTSEFAVVREHRNGRANHDKRSGPCGGCAVARPPTGSGRADAGRRYALALTSSSLVAIRYVGRRFTVPSRAGFDPTTRRAFFSLT